MKGFASKRSVLSALALGLLAASAHSNAGDLSFLASGSVLGTVEDAGGIPQMGASVQLFNKFERLIARTTTNADGRFAFASLPSDVYSVRVSAASYLPVLRDRIAVKSGMDSLLRVHLASLLSNVEVSYSVPKAGMTDDWKWVLRSSPATRAITRFLPGDISKSQSPEQFPRIFSGTHAMLSLSGGDSNIIDADSSRGDMGTGFIVSTNILGKNQLQLGGNYAQTAGNGPSAVGLVAIYSRDPMGGPQESPEVTFSVSQLGLIGGAALSGGAPGAAAPIPGSSLSVRTMALSIYQTIDPIDNVHFEYGVTGESVDYLQHSSRISPFARLTVSEGKAGKIVAAYSDGSRPDELIAHQQRENRLQDGNNDDLEEAAGSLTRLPQLSYSHQRLVLQRIASYELGYQKVSGSRTYAVSIFYEDVANGRANVAGNTSILDPGDLLSDGVSRTEIYNIGNYKRNGALASVNQRVGDSVDLSAAYGRMGGFTTDAAFGTNSQAPLLDERSRNVANAALKARIPHSGTKILANFGWMGSGAFVPQHYFTTEDAEIAPGLNLFVRQPLPSLFGIPGHMEITADLRNLLAQGYLPVSGGTVTGHNLLVVQSPRGLRGGLNFIF